MLLQVHHRARLLAILLAALTLPPAAGSAAAQVPTPQSHFGFRIGADGELASADAIEKYFELVASTSDRVKIVEIGPTTEGHRTIGAIITSAQNIANLDQIREANQRLADPRILPADEAGRRNGRPT